MIAVFKMRDSLPSASYSSVCNVLRQWSISLIPTYRVYRLYDNVYGNKNKIQLTKSRTGNIIGMVI